MITKESKCASCAHCKMCRWIDEVDQNGCDFYTKSTEPTTNVKTDAQAIVWLKSMQYAIRTDPMNQPILMNIRANNKMAALDKAINALEQKENRKNKNNGRITNWDKFKEVFGIPQKTGLIPDGDICNIINCTTVSCKSCPLANVGWETEYKENEE